jgi:membrane protein implicated in regulation of membrane protease activity
MDSTPTTPRPTARSDLQPQRREDFGVPGLLVVSLIIMTFMVAAISLLAVTGAAWALWLAFAVMLLSCGVLMASITAMFNEPDESAPVPETREQRAQQAHEARTRSVPRRSARPAARPVAHGGH